MTLNDPAIKLNTAYHWKVRSCAMFDSGKKNPGDCDDWSKEYSFVTTGRPPKTDTMKPDLGTTITFPQNFTWEMWAAPKLISLNFTTAITGKSPPKQSNTTAIKKIRRRRSLATPISPSPRKAQPIPHTTGAYKRAPTAKQSTAATQVNTKILRYTGLPRPH